MITYEARATGLDTLEIYCWECEEDTTADVLSGTVEEVEVKCQECGERTYHTTED